MKRTMKVFMIASFILMVLTPLALAKGDSMHKGKMVGRPQGMSAKMDLNDMFFHKAHFIMMKADELDLTDDQVRKIEDLKYSRLKSSIMNKANIDSLAVDIKAALGKDPLDVKAINTLIDKKYSLKAQNAKDMVQACADLKTVLTAAQKNELKTLWKSDMKEMGGKMRGNKGMMNVMGQTPPYEEECEEKEE